MTTALTIASAGIGAVSSIFSAGSEFSAGRYRAAVAERNKIIAEENARRAIERSQQEQQDQDLQARVLMGEQQAAQGASGLSFGSRSFALTRARTRELAQRDAFRIREAGAIDAQNFRQQGEDFGNQARFERTSATGSLVQGFLGAGASLITGAAKVRGAKNYTAPKFRTLVT